MKLRNWNVVIAACLLSFVRKISAFVRILFAFFAFSAVKFPDDMGTAIAVSVFVTFVSYVAKFLLSPRLHSVPFGIKCRDVDIPSY